MDIFFRRKRVLKTLLSLSLVFASLLMIQKFKLVENSFKDNDDIDTKIGDRWWGVGLQRDLHKGKGDFSKSSLGNYSPSVLGDVDAQRVTVSNATPASWDVHVMNCSEDSDARNQDWFRLLDPRFHQFVLHRHCRYFPMLINHPDKCRDEEVHLLMVVKSVIEQHDRRDAVRKTWGKEQTVNGKKIKTLFLLGSPTNGKDTKILQKLIEYENRIYGDILQWDFMDTFFNLTLKEINFLKWFDIHCSSAKFIFKGDDDVFVNTDNLLELISFKIEDRKVLNMFVGDTISKAIPIRNRQSKYYIPKELYDKPYPPYVGGGGFVMSSQLARRLFVVSEDLELYPIDDVFLGMCLQKLHLAPEMHPGFRTFGIMKRRVSPMNSEPCFYKNLIVVHKLSPDELLRMWSIVQNEDLVCAKRTAI
ncbi:UDP-GlcNAc:betaGal beta-1,3-N-acetylglucosaminyltransferase 7, like [Hypomesus transpacificus]|uniref:UDP-GlcNAc:betaGal beta-1,3-N-acetylglucosaminyltransferase 7, like n=1 Tax=Hypomesus transpacificus TaxID=137520 RepID=UPI001F079A74|nr:UDP-GlcNAc:betaGal beta-1,3-N-acetylglucosaminyltransferase 7, like [Hypomesus transpacificus]